MVFEDIRGLHLVGSYLVGSYLVVYILYKKKQWSRRHFKNTFETHQESNTLNDSIVVLDQLTFVSSN